MILLLKYIGLRKSWFQCLRSLRLFNVSVIVFIILVLVLYGYLSHAALDENDIPYAALHGAHSANLSKFKRNLQKFKIREDVKVSCSEISSRIRIYR